MKRKLSAMFCTGLAAVMMCATLFAGCFGGNGDNDTTPKNYVVQYSTDEGVIELDVTQGKVFKLETLPEKTGYEFTGLYDAQTGGTQIVDANGSSLAPFYGSSDCVLFPRFEPKEYTVILDYQGAEVSGARQVKATYDQSLPELPTQVVYEHKEFTGWYTKTESKGELIADKHGLIPVVSVFNENNFNIMAGDITLYAGFETEKIEVTCHFEDGTSETVKVDYDSPVSAVIPAKRKDGNAVLSWSKEQDGEKYNGKITQATDLYALEYAPVIELDLDGGYGASPVVAKPGDAVQLPVPQKDLAQFLYWENEQGNKYSNTVMPENSITLKAVWQAKISFDVNGGSDVEDISVAAGEAITLPMPEKEGYVFAGWYTADKEQYVSTKMPAKGIKLKAGWYKGKKVTVTLVQNNTGSKLSVSGSTQLTAKQRLKLDLSEILPTIGDNGLNIAYKLNFKWGNTDKYYSASGKIALYDGSEFNSANEIKTKDLSHGDDRDSYIIDSMSGSANIKNNVLYVYYAGKGNGRIYLNGGYGYNVGFYDIYADIYYPITTQLFV